MEAPKTENRSHPPTPTYDPSIQLLKQPSSPPSPAPETRQRPSPPIELSRDGANQGDSNSRNGPSDRLISRAPGDGQLQSTSPSGFIPLPRAASPEHLAREAPGGFTVGSTKDEVLAAQGTPTEFSGQVWRYGSSSVFFSGDKVTSWDVWPSSPLKVQMLPSQSVETRKGYFTVGSSKDEVLVVQGTPSKFTNRVWKYRSSSVFFSDDRVTSWDVWPGSPLKVRMLPSRPAETTKGYFTVGSSKDEVLAVQGTPTKLSDRVWKYRSSSVFFSDDRVTSWDVWPGSPLKVRLENAKNQ
jgi:outer membrane protein assembly factor BamE (lipoprotein component of BamABCDE complex)